MQRSEHMIGITEDDWQYMEDWGYRLLRTYSTREQFEADDDYLDSDRQHLVATENADGLQVWESPRQKKAGAVTPANTKR